MEIKQTLSSFGLNDKEQGVYVLLVKTGWSTVLNLSRKTPIKRTTLYRVLESLEKKGLIEVRVDDKTTYYRASDPRNFESLIIENEKKVKEMRSTLNELSSYLKTISLGKGLETSVRFYRGVRGIQSIEWKLCCLRNEEIFLLGPSRWANCVGEEFAEKVRMEHYLSKTKIREILNPIDSQVITKDGETPWTKNKQYLFTCYQHRIIEKEKIKLGGNNDLVITKNTIFLYSLEEDEIVGIEISNTGYATLMRQIFKILWNMARAIDSFSGKDFKI